MPDISVIVPVYNRGELIRYTLESVRRASSGLEVETIVVDDGSVKPVQHDLAHLGYAREARVIRQENRGLLFARLAGLAAVTGRYTLFLDSDDLVAPQKLRAQFEAMERTRSDVCYTNIARCALAGDFNALVPQPEPPARTTSDIADFFINVQPAPHSPLFRTSYLRDLVERAFFPPLPLYNSVAEIWFYHNAAPRDGRVVHVPGPLTICGYHDGVRLTNHWERLGVASLGVMEAFARSVPDAPEYRHVRELVGEKAFRSWRRLPRDFSPEFGARHVALWRKLAPHSRADRLGGRGFRAAARLLGPGRAARFLRHFQSASYETCRTMSDAEFAVLLGALPKP